MKYELTNFENTIINVYHKIMQFLIQFNSFIITVIKSNFKYLDIISYDVENYNVDSVLNDT